MGPDLDHYSAKGQGSGSVFSKKPGSGSVFSKKPGSGFARLILTMLWLWSSSPEGVSQEDPVEVDADLNTSGVSPYIQCCGSEIRCHYDTWIRDSGWVKNKKNQDSDPG